METLSPFRMCEAAPQNPNNAAQDQLEQIKLARLQALIGLYKALGGGRQAGSTP